MASNDTVSIRPARPGDTAAIAAIYNQGIADRIATFETRERTSADILTWLGEPRHPVLVAEQERQVRGWVAAFPYRPRECYRGVAEFSVYVDRAARGRRIGDRLLEPFVLACESAGLWKLVSRIFCENGASRALCAKHRFREVGIYERHAQLDGRWRDVVIVERCLEANRTA